MKNVDVKYIGELLTSRSKEPASVRTYKEYKIKSLCNSHTEPDYPDRQEEQIGGATLKPTRTTDTTRTPQAPQVHHITRCGSGQFLRQWVSFSVMKMSWSIFCSQRSASNLSVKKACFDGLFFFFWQDWMSGVLFPRGSSLRRNSPRTLVNSFRFCLLFSKMLLL
jgi:hypothetical protein